MVAQGTITWGIGHVARGRTGVRIFARTTTILSFYLDSVGFSMQGEPILTYYPVAVILFALMIVEGATEQGMEDKEVQVLGVLRCRHEVSAFVRTTSVVLLVR